MQLVWLKILKYKNSWCGIRFDSHGFFEYPSGETGRNVKIFGVDMSSFRKIDNRKEYILILGKGPTQGLEHTLSAKKMCSIILLKIITNSVWARIILKQTFISSLMAWKFINLKQKILKL